MANLTSQSRAHRLINHDSYIKFLQHLPYQAFFRGFASLLEAPIYLPTYPQLLSALLIFFLSPDRGEVGNYC